jgi:hypothetical protein
MIMTSGDGLRHSRALLVVSRGGHPSIDDALNHLVSEKLLRYAHHAVVGDSGRIQALDVWSHLTTLVREQNVDLVVLHHYHGQGLPDARPFIDLLRSMPHRPVVALSAGDAFYGLFQPTHPQKFRDICSGVDIVLNTSMGVAADAIVGYGARRVALWPLGACQVRFAKDVRPRRQKKSEFEVIFIGSNNRSRNPTSSYFWFSRKRERLLRQLVRKFGDGFAVFGSGWDHLPNSHGPVSFDAQVATCRRARVIVGGVPYSPVRYYASNRPFIQILSGVPFVDLNVEGVDRILRNEDHWYLTDTLDDVVDRCDDLLSRPEAEREEQGYRAARYVANHHTNLERWRGLVHTLTGLREGASDESSLSPPDLSFFLPETDVDTELPLATRGWADAKGAPGGMGDQTEIL